MTQCILPWTNRLSEVLSLGRPAFQKILKGVIRKPLPGHHLMVGSDFSGSHARSDYRVYAFLLADADLSPRFPDTRRTFRAEFLPDGRRMSYKGLNDALRRRALIPFLDSVEALTGVCCVVVVHKSLGRMSTGQRSVDIWRQAQGLDGKWTAPAFENMVRIVHFVCLLLGATSRPNQHVTWITDEDEIVANDGRLTDTMNVMNLMACLFVHHPLGEFAMNSTRVDSGDRTFEDFVAVPDLVAGAFSDITTAWARQPEWQSAGDLDLEAAGIARKASLIGAWFCAEAPTLKRCAMIVDQHGEGTFHVLRLCVDS